MKRLLFIWTLFSCYAASAQVGFSIATDMSVQRNFKKEQQYWAIGQTVHTQFHITPKEGVYVWFAYYSNGKFKNNVTATGKSGAVVPQTISYVNSAKMRLKEFSIGYKKYIIGSALREDKVNYYFYAGFGLEMGRVINTHSVAIDTVFYSLPVLSGQANFKRLSIDPGIGVDRYLIADMFLYAEIRAWIPTTDYPSRYIFVNENAPWVAMFNLGLRVLF